MTVKLTRYPRGILHETRVDILQTSLPGVVVIKPRVHEDPRGFFMETYRAEALAEAGIHDNFVQDNHARSVRGVLRGLHYQLQHPQAKLCRVVSGEVFDVAVDVRLGSPTLRAMGWSDLVGREQASDLRAAWLCPWIRGALRDCRLSLQVQRLLRRRATIAAFCGVTPRSALRGMRQSPSCQPKTSSFLAWPMCRARCCRGTSREAACHRRHRTDWLAVAAHACSVGRGGRAHHELNSTCPIPSRRRMSFARFSPTFF